MTHFLDYLADRVVLCDGAMGTQVQARNLDIERDFLGLENCTEILCESRPDLVREIHRGYLEAGCDALQTNSFGGSPVTLGEFGIADRTFELNRRAAELAREAIAEFAYDGRTRFVLGSLGPGTRLPSLGHISYQDLEDALALQCAGLIAGGSDAIAIETCQDPLQIKAAVNGAKRARDEAGKDIPILVSVTVETTGTLLVGADIAAAATVVNALDVPVIGLNCATGPREMAEHVKWLGENWPGHISVQPNAGLPELVDGRTHYPLGPTELAQWLERFVLEDGVGLIGGCCGTEAAHIAALDAMLRRIGRDRPRPLPRRRNAVWAPSVASLYGQVNLRQENAYLSIGERCNANGSRQFRRLQEQGDWDGCVEMGREQVKEGSHTLDLCTAFVGRDEIADMTEAVTRMRGAVNAPLVIELDRIPGARSGPQALRRQADHQLDQFRGRRRGGRQAPGSCAPLRHGGDRADDRRDRHGEGGRAQIAGGAAPLRFRLRQARPAALGSAVRPADLHDLHRQRGRPQARPVDVGGDRADLARHARMPDHSRPVEHLVRPQPAGAPRPQLGLSRPCATPRPHRRNRAFLADRAVAQDPGRRGAGRRGSDLRPPRARATTRCRPISRCSKTARPRRPRRRAARKSSRTGSRSASSMATGSISKPISTWRCRITRRSTSSTTSCSAA